MPTKREAIASLISKRVEAMGYGGRARVATVMGVTDSTVTRWVTGDATPRPERWSDLEEVLRLTPGSIAQIWSNQGDWEMVMVRIESTYQQHLDGELIEIDAASDLLGRLPDSKLATEVAAIRATLLELEEQCSGMLAKLSEVRGRLLGIDPDFDLF